MANTETYVVIQWPEIQEYMDLQGFRDNSYLINDEKGMDDFGSSAYFVNKEWLDSLSKMDYLIVHENGSKDYHLYLRSMGRGISDYMLSEEEYLKLYNAIKKTLELEKLI